MQCPWILGHIHSFSFDTWFKKNNNNTSEAKCSTRDFKNQYHNSYIYFYRFHSHISVAVLTKPPFLCFISLNKKIKIVRKKLYDKINYASNEKIIGVIKRFVQKSDSEISHTLFSLFQFSISFPHTDINTLTDISIN